VPQKSTYYTETELDELEALAEERDDSFSGIVRQAIQEHYGISND